LGKIGGFASLGHKVCLFHFLFITVIIFPLRLVTVLAPKSFCARKLAERLAPKPFKAREFGKKKMTFEERKRKRSATANTRKRSAAPQVIILQQPLPEGASVVVFQQQSPQVTSSRRPVERIITARKLVFCDKIKMLPLFFIRDICGIIVNIFKIFGLSLNVFVFIEPFIDFQRKSLELQKIRVSGCSFAFSADPADAYMRWLNLKLVDLLTMGLYEKIFEKKARKAYLGFLDSQIRWDVDPKEIPIGFDTKRNFVYFSSVVPSLETTILELIYLLPMVLLPWPSLFAKHRLTASWQLTLSKYRFGGRQPRLGGDFVGEENCACNDAGFKKACKLNTKALCLALDIGPCGKAYEVALENSIEWVVPPPKKACRFTYHLCPFPCGGHDEEALSIDVAIPIVVDDLELYDFKLPKKCDANAIKRSEIETILEKWVKKAPKPLRAQRTKSLARYGTTKDIIQRYTGGALPR